MMITQQNDKKKRKIWSGSATFGIYTLQGRKDGPHVVSLDRSTTTSVKCSSRPSCCFERPKSGNKLAQGWLKVLIPRKTDVKKIDLGIKIHKFRFPIIISIKFVMDSKVMKKNTYWQSHSAIRLQCNEMRFDYHMFPFSNLVT